MSFQKSHSVGIGGEGLTRRISLGGDAPIAIQTMWKESLLGADLIEVARKIGELEQLGCDVLRFAVPDMESVEAFVKLCSLTPMPLVADIHFDYRLALACMDGAVAKVRINPGNIGNKEKVTRVVQTAKDKGIGIRIGVNSGSLPSDLKKIYAGNIRDRSPEAIEERASCLVEAALREAAYFDELNFSDFLVSMKSPSVEETVRANELFAEKTSIPLHLGVTEAGPLVQGIVKSTLAFSRLLNNNIGATVRVSLSDSMENEVIAARSILTELHKRAEGVRLVSCPRCGRVGFDVRAFVERWQSTLLGMEKNITVAIMGCPVNGPGEGKHADIGITGAGDNVVIFKHGKVVARVNLENLSDDARIIAVDNAFKKEIDCL